MRTARLVGLSPDGMSLIVATDGGDELTIAADDRLRAAVRGDLPRLGQLENEMETTLSPRDIQTRIRGGASLAEVAEVAGIPMDRVERFAAPVLAERDHVAITAMAGSVRRRGETSGHRNLRITVTERLVSRDVDLDAVAWDSFRLDDGRWTVSADYAVGDEPRHAEFVYDPRARFSVAGNDDARWLLGERAPAAPGSDPGDGELTVDLTDELALVRATQEAPAAIDEAAEPTIALVRTLPSAPRATPVPATPEPEPEPEPDLVAEQPEQPASTSPLDTLDAMLSGADEDEHYAGLRDEPPLTEVTLTEVTLTEVTLTDIHVRSVETSQVDPTEEPAVVSAISRPTDASAVPATPDGGGWEPGIVVNVPVEPSSVEDGGTDEPSPPDPIVDGAGRADEVREFELEAEVEAPPVRKPPKKKRASVPSWDEIMFGGPRPPTA